MRKPYIPTRVGLDGPDWCHLCGRRLPNLAAVWIPGNAEHERNDPDHTPTGPARYVRMCLDCWNHGRRLAIEGRPK